MITGTDDSALSIDTPLAGPVQATTEYDPDTGRYALRFSGNAHVQGTLSIVPDISEDDEHDERTAAELRPALHLSPHLNRSAPDASELRIFGQTQCTQVIARPQHASLDTLLALREANLHFLGAEPGRSIYFALIKALVQAVADDPRREQITARWREVQERLSAERTAQALGKVEAELADLQELAAKLRAQRERPFPPIAWMNEN